MAEAQDNDARQINRISNQTAEALKIRQVKFQGVVRADEQESHRQWSVSFELVEHLSVPERVEQRQPDKPFIRCVLPLGFKLPGIKEGESRY